MDNSPLNRLPGELRNQIYEDALSFPYMTVTFDAAGHSDDGPKKYLALARTCRQVREETAKYVATAEVTRFLLQPPSRPTACPGGTVIDQHFKLYTWLDNVRGLQGMCPKVVTLDLGHLESPNVQNAVAQKAPYRNMIRCIPFPWKSRCKTSSDFHVQFYIVDEALGKIHFSFRLQEQGQYVGTFETTARGHVDAVLQGKQSLLKSFVKDSWTELNVVGLAKQRQAAWQRLYSARFLLAEFISDLGKCQVDRGTLQLEIEREEQERRRRCKRKAEVLGVQYCEAWVGSVPIGPVRVTTLAPLRPSAPRRR